MNFDQWREEVRSRCSPLKVFLWKKVLQSLEGQFPFAVRNKIVGFLPQLPLFCELCLSMHENIIEPQIENLRGRVRYPDCPLFQKVLLLHRWVPSCYLHSGHSSPYSLSSCSLCKTSVCGNCRQVTQDKNEKGLSLCFFCDNSVKLT